MRPVGAGADAGTAKNPVSGTAFGSFYIIMVTNPLLYYMNHLVNHRFIIHP